MQKFDSFLFSLRIAPLELKITCIVAIFSSRHALLLLHLKKGGCFSKPNFLPDHISSFARLSKPITFRFNLCSRLQQLCRINIITMQLWCQRDEKNLNFHPPTFHFGCLKIAGWCESESVSSCCSFRRSWMCVLSCERTNMNRVKRLKESALPLGCVSGEKHTAEIHGEEIKAVQGVCFSLSVARTHTHINTHSQTHPTPSHFRLPFSLGFQLRPPFTSH